MRVERRRIFAALGALAAGAALPPRLAAQDAWPNRPLRLSLGVPPGGSAEIVFRPMIAQLAPRLGQPIVMEYRPGANQAISTAYVAKSPPDGYTLGFVTDGIMSIAPALPAPLPFDAINDLTPVAVTQHVSLILVTPRANPIASLADLVVRARASPGKVSYGSLGIGSIAHIAMEVFAMENGIELLHVPYKGTADAVAAAAAGDIDVTFVSIGVVLPHIPGRLRPIALASPQRHPRVADVPTFTEALQKPFEVRAWFGLAMARATPEPIVGRLRSEIWRIVSAEAFVKDVLAPSAAEASTVPPEKLEAFVRADQDKWRDWVRRLGPRLKLN